MAMQGTRYHGTPGAKVLPKGGVACGGKAAAIYPM